MLRVAVPNKGSLSETATKMLAESGYRVRRDQKTLVVSDARNDVEFFYLRPRDIATYVGEGTLDVGITGRDLLIDSGSSAHEIAALHFGESTFRFAAPTGSMTNISEIEGRRVATSYPVLVGRFLEEHGIDARLVKLDGAVESAIRLGVADVIADVVETGTTLRGAGLETFGEEILRSSAVLIGNKKEHAQTEVLLRRLQGVLVARQYVMLDYDCPIELLDEASALSPGLESPTVSPLRDPDWVAVRSMVRRDDTNDVMDALYALGARAILMTPIHAARI